jgi:hypothetical protein
MRFLTKLALLGGAAYAAKWAYDNYVAPDQQSAGNAPSTTGERVRIGYDTPTGTDPPVEDNNGDMDEAASRFRET